MGYSFRLAARLFQNQNFNDPPQKKKRLHPAYVHSFIPFFSFVPSFILFFVVFLQLFPPINEVMVKPLQIAKNRYEEMKSLEDSMKKEVK